MIFVKYYHALLLMFIFLIIIPTSFAGDNSTVDDISSSDSSDNSILTTTSVYFNSSSPVDGNGTQDNPYRYFSTTRVSGASNVYFASGVYDLDKNFNINNLVITGQESAVLNGKGHYISLNGDLTISNLTLNNSYMTVKGNLICNNVVFENNTNRLSAIYCTNRNSNIALDYCRFINNYGYFGGAIYIKENNINLSISNSFFESNHADVFGGAISAIGNINLNITNSNFNNNNPSNKAGGAIYAVRSILNIQYSNFTSSKASFGGAICDLGSNTTIKSIIISDCEALYDGGAIYKMYGTMNISSSSFISNRALNGGALFGDNSTLFNVKLSTFKSNSAVNYGGAIYTVLSQRESIIDNIYSSNTASYYKNCYKTNSYNLFIGNGNYTRFINDFDFNGTIPSYYDLRDYNLVTPVKNQGDGGNCWAFSSLATLESCILKASAVGYDLSEENMKNLLAYYSDDGWNMQTNTGGYEEMSIGYLTSWLGCINESQDKYNAVDVLSPVLNSSIHVQNVLYLNRLNFTDNDAIKEAILKYGAVSSGIYYISSYLNGFSYYYDGTNGNNHAVCIVGWDDNYSKDNFKKTPQGDGAWICKNSWGSGWGNNGYFYVSYYDVGCAKCGAYAKSTYTFILNDTVRYDKNYQYDIIGITDYFITGKNNIWYENIFNATSDELLVAFSTYFNTTTDWQAQIYVNNNLRLTQNGSSVAGYFTINLDEFIPLKTNDVFKIILNIQTNKYASFPVSEKARANRVLYMPGVSYFSYDGVEWFDLYDYTSEFPEYGHHYNSQVACIKAFTSNTLNTNIELLNSGLIVLNASCDVTAKITDEYGNLVNTGKVVFNFDSKNYTVDVDNGYAKILSNFTIGNHDVNAYYIENPVYFSSNSSANYTVVDIGGKLTLSISDIICGDDLVIKNTLISSNNTKLVGNVNVVIGSNTYVVEANSETTFSNNLKPGFYIAKGSYGNILASTSFNVYKSPINVSLDVIKRYADDVNINVNFSKPINEVVNVKVNSKSYNVKVVNGFGVLAFNNLSYGKYIVSVNYSSEFYADCFANTIFSVNFVKTSIIASDVVMYYHDGTRFSLTLLDNNKNPISDKLVSIFINNVAYNRTTDSKGIASMAINLNKGSYPVFISFSGTDRYLPSNLTSNILIKTTIVGKDVTKYYRNATQFYATIYDFKGNPVKNQDIVMNINGVLYHRYTNENGVVRLNLNLDPGNYILTTINTVTNESSSNNILILSRFVDNKDLVKYYKNASKYSARILSGNGKPLANVAVTFNINGVLYKRITDSSGVASLAINLDPGDYVITAQYGESQASNKIKVLTILQTKDLVMNYKDGSKFKATILDGRGKPYTSQIVYFNINGVLYTKLTDKNGVASLNINLIPGVYIITSGFNDYSTGNTITIH